MKVIGHQDGQNKMSYHTIVGVLYRKFGIRFHLTDAAGI